MTKTPKDILAQVNTRGEFRELRKRAEQGRNNGSENLEIPTDSPVWDVYEQVKSYWQGSTTNWDTKPPLVWYTTLSDLTHEQLGNGVQNFAHHKNDIGVSDFAPNPGQFRDLCLTNFKWEQQAHKPFDPPVMIEDTGKKARNAAAHAQWRKDVGLA